MSLASDECSIQGYSRHRRSAWHIARAVQEYLDARVRALLKILHEDVSLVAIAHVLVDCESKASPAQAWLQCVEFGGSLFCPVEGRARGL